jgi:dienelactone hydrolase
MGGKPSVSLFRRWRRRVALVAGFALILAPRPSPASETVHFRSLEVPPTEFRIALAAARGQVARPEPADEIAGELYRPAGDGPFPAIVALHGCGGRSRSAEAIHAARFVEWGYVYLAVDSLAPRGITENCGPTRQTAIADQSLDAFGALDYLAAQHFVDSSKIAVLGFSAGGGAALAVAAKDGVQTLAQRRFAAAIAYYPELCGLSRTFAVPTLILIGALDDWASVNECRTLAADPAHGPIKLVIYPGAHHDFDYPALAAGADYYGHHLQYDAAADRAATTELRAFVRQQLGR